MTFQKGVSPNPNGRPKGSKNYKTEHWERFANWLISENMENLSTEMKKLKGKDLVLCTVKLMEYFKPKLSRKVDEDGNDATEVLIIKYADHDGNNRAIQLSATPVSAPTLPGPRQGD